MPSHQLGYLTIDHRNSPGIPGSKLLCEGTFFEADTRTCNHCRVPVIMNPMRTRERFTCPGCFKYCCDLCAAGYHVNKICMPFDQIVDHVKSGKLLVPVLAKDLPAI